MDINGILSNENTVLCGVPQGSLLGPVLFLIYTNDMKSAVDCKLLLYADDSVLLVSHKDPKFVSEKLGIEVQNCSDWFVDNQLSMHPGKTELILFSSQNKLKKIRKFGRNFQYLRFYLDNNLSGKTMCEKTIKKAAGKINFLFRQRKIWI